jgi:hypothetical protein
MQKLVFLSYSSDTSLYVDEFAPLFRRSAGDPEIYFYGDTPIPAGDLYEELRAKIAVAPVFLCFLNAGYAVSLACRNEFDMACALQASAGGTGATKRFFVPTVLDQTGVDFWIENIKPTKSAAWASNLIYTKLIDPKTGTRPAPLYIDGKSNDPFPRRVQELGRKVKERMNW